VKKYGVPLERALEVMDELKDESDALKERIQELADRALRAERELDEALGVLRSLPHSNRGCGECIAHAYLKHKGKKA
jgi:uncharacterized coiled-coil DUF342 family protein